MRLPIVLAGLVAIAAACTKESVRPSVAEAGSGDAEAEASAPAASAATAATPPITPEAGTNDAGGLTTGASGDAGVRTVSLDDASDGKTVEIRKGGTIVLLLAASPTSGFDWAVLKAPPALGTPALDFVAGGDQMGASGKRRIVWTVKDALPAGDHAVELGYARSFEKGVAPFKTFRFKVRAAK